MKSLNKELSNGRQSVEYKETLEHNDRKIRIEIKSDSYRNQCYARAKLWDGDKWNFVDDIPSSEMSTKDGLAYMPPERKATSASFKSDRDKLIKLVKDVI